MRSAGPKLSAAAASLGLDQRQLPVDDDGQETLALGLCKAGGDRCARTRPVMIDPGIHAASLIREAR